MKHAILFDVDGTLLNTEPIYMRAWVEAGRLFGYEIGNDALLGSRAVSIPVAKQVFADACGADFPYDEVRRERVRLSEAWIEEIPAEKLLMPGAREALDTLRQRGFTLAVATSTASDVTKKHLKQADLADYFAAAAGGDEVLRGKPAPDIFLLAAKRSGTAPEACLVVGDTPADVKGARAAGMDVILIPDQVPETTETRRLSFRVLPEIRDLPDAVAAWEQMKRNG